MNVHSVLVSVAVAPATGVPWSVSPVGPRTMTWTARLKVSPAVGEPWGLVPEPVPAPELPVPTRPLSLGDTPESPESLHAAAIATGRTMASDRRIIALC